MLNDAFNYLMTREHFSKYYKIIINLSEEHKYNYLVYNKRAMKDSGQKHRYWYIWVWPTHVRIEIPLSVLGVHDTRTGLFSIRLFFSS